MSKPVQALVPTMAGAIAAIAVMLLIGWPGRPPLTGTATVVAALAIAVLSVLLVARVAAAGHRPVPPQRAPAASVAIPCAQPRPAVRPSGMLAA